MRMGKYEGGGIHIDLSCLLQHDRSRAFSLWMAHALSCHIFARARAHTHTHTHTHTHIPKEDYGELVIQGSALVCVCACVGRVCVRESEDQVNHMTETKLTSTRKFYTRIMYCVIRPQ